METIRGWRMGKARRTFYLEYLGRGSQCFVEFGLKIVCSLFTQILLCITSSLRVTSRAS